MSEPVLFGLPLSVAFLYFIFYSVCGWLQETVYCSVKERRLVPRGFLYGPLCPIYGVGVLMMIFWFRPLMDRPVLFYVVAVVGMSAWEFLVGWFLETTTHIRYWDYSDRKFNLKGYICLSVSLAWGVLSFLVLYFIHPIVERRLAWLRGSPLYFADGVFLGVLLADATATVYQLAKAAQMLEKLQQAGDELRLQASLGKAELSDKLTDMKDKLGDMVPEPLDEAGRAMKERYDAIMSRAEYYTRRFRYTYRDMKMPGPANQALESVKRQGEKLRSLRSWLPGQKKSGK